MRVGWISVEKEQFFSKFDNFNISCSNFLRLFFYPGKNQFGITYVGVSSLSFQATFGLWIKNTFVVYMWMSMPIFLYNVGHKFYTCAFESGLWISVEKEIIYSKISNIQEWQYFLDHFFFWPFFCPRKKTNLKLPTYVFLHCPFIHPFDFGQVAFLTMYIWTTDYVDIFV